ncbi:hypothetical protein JTB14_028639 [Gonioctena quinquepunctata]|nr:hypothetical protein JTB14_028639 [Gonioctena quinquepunctata]
MSVHVEDWDILEVIQVVKKQGNEPRSMEVITGHRNYSTKVQIRDSDIKIAADLTNIQQKNSRNKNEELKNRDDNGKTDLGIKCMMVSQKSVKELNKE